VKRLNSKICKKCKIEKPLSEFDKNLPNDYRIPRETCKTCYRAMRRKYARVYKKKHPWYSAYTGAKYRCTTPSDKSFKNYGGRGIKFLMSLEDFKTLWFRDKAWLLGKHSIDRIDNDGNYELSNCRFVEFDENSIKDRKMPVIQCSDKMQKIWPSQTEAAAALGISSASISVAIKYNQQSCGYRWYEASKTAINSMGSLEKGETWIKN
jgi:hypothetical protein